ncbi:(d)CMP kinase [Thiothrix litoralis]|jgi:cytidylate kinase|uniref:Cytidylate kinase n=1 Tax=Thiothrix litoralis TaxID=2891210 RepID=A0ABX7WUN5_9GAMM|nr:MULTISPECIES: (d)CMP kinase [Thiothrix]QTR46947.1 (d)CMP kinase [Thiothrix litoralis]WMP17387.1 (d)CMP kinase [Thiothrix lacustris]
MNTPSPVITLDGPAGAGKGTIACMLADKLGWHMLDSGAIYRVAALAALRSGVGLGDEKALAALLPTLNIEFNNGEAWLNGEMVTGEIRNETCASATSQIAALPAVRAALLVLQRNFRQLPGLVADGRDMGTVVFPEATHKFYLTASAEIRAERRLKQLSQQGLSAKLCDLIQDINARDERDTNRPVAPLKPAADALVIDTGSLDQTEVFATVLHYIT